MVSKIVPVTGIQSVSAQQTPKARADTINSNFGILADKVNELIQRANGVDIPPVAKFVYTQPTATSISVDASGSTDIDGSIVSYGWAFGDGSTAAGKTASHVYAKSGNYSVTLTVTDDRGSATSALQTVPIVTPSVNNPPTASFTSALAADNATVNVDASASKDADGTIVSYGWTFGDGAKATGKTASHVYAATGNYTITLTVTDDDGATATATRVVSPSIVVVTPTPPTTGSGDPGINQTGVAGQQQTPSGALLFQNLSGSTTNAKVKSAAGSAVSFAAGTFTFSDFTGGVDGGSSSSGNTGSGLQFTSGTKSIYGAGSKSTKLQMVQNSSSRSSSVPAQGSGSTNQLQYVDVNGVPDGFVMDGVEIDGTAQGHLYNGLRVHNPGNATFRNSTITGIPGSAGSPPGETFMMNVFSQQAGKTLTVQNMTFDGSQGGSNVAAALLGTNSTAGTINMIDCLFRNNRYSSTATIWELAKGGTINIVRPVVTGYSTRIIGNEAQAGTINITDPMFVDPVNGDDVRITWTSNYNEGTINVYFTTQAKYDAFFAARSKKTLTTICSVKQGYGGTAGGAYPGLKDIRDYCHLFIAGTEVSKTNRWTFTGSPVNTPQSGN